MHPAPKGASGVAVYVGVTGSGKSTLAVAHAREISARTGEPTIFLDMEHSLPDTWDAEYVTGAHDALDASYVARRHTVFRGHPAEVGELLSHVRTVGDRCVVVDGSTHLLSAHSRPGAPLSELMRGHRHARAWLLLVTQHFSGDIPQAMLACTPHLYIFRTLQPATLRVFERDYGLNPDELRILPVGASVHHYMGFAPGA